jgi:hypothetical protein
MTIYESLAKKLRRDPTNAELRAEVERIKEESLLSLAKAGRLSHQRGSRHRR